MCHVSLSEWRRVHCKSVHTRKVDRVISRTFQLGGGGGGGGQNEELQLCPPEMGYYISNVHNTGQSQYKASPPQF